MRYPGWMRSRFNERLPSFASLTRSPSGVESGGSHAGAARNSTPHAVADVARLVLQGDLALLGALLLPAADRRRPVEEGALVVAVLGVDHEARAPDLAELLPRQRGLPGHLVEDVAAVDLDAELHRLGVVGGRRRQRHRDAQVVEARLAARGHERAHRVGAGPAELARGPVGGGAHEIGRPALEGALRGRGEGREDPIPPRSTTRAGASAAEPSSMDPPPRRRARAGRAAAPRSSSSSPPSASAASVSSSSPAPTIMWRSRGTPRAPPR